MREHGQIVLDSLGTRLHTHVVNQIFRRVTVSILYFKAQNGRGSCKQRRIEPRSKLL